MSGEDDTQSLAPGRTEANDLADNSAGAGEAHAKGLEDPGDSMMELPSFGADVPEEKRVGGEPPGAPEAVQGQASQAAQAFDLQKQLNLSRIQTNAGANASVRQIDSNWRANVSNEERTTLVRGLYRLLRARYTKELDSTIQTKLLGIARSVEARWYQRATSKEEYFDQKALKENFTSLTSTLKRPREESDANAGQQMNQASIAQPNTNRYENGVDYGMMVSTQGYTVGPGHTNAMVHPVSASVVPGQVENALPGNQSQGYNMGIEGPILLRPSARNGGVVDPSSLGVAGSNVMQNYPLQPEQHGMSSLHSSRIPQMIPVEQQTQHTLDPNTSNGNMDKAGQGSGLDGVTAQTSSQGVIDQSARKNQILKQQRWLLFLRHCTKCKAAPGQCQFKQTCNLAKDLWRHLVECKDTECQYPRCSTSRILLQHHQKCRDRNCPTCIPVKQYVAKQKEALRNKGLSDEQRIRSQRTSVDTYQQPVLDLAGQARREEREKELLSNEKNMGTSLVEFFTIDEIEEHLKLLRLSDAVAKPPGVPGRKPSKSIETIDGVLSHEIIEESQCQLCNHSRLLFEPPALYCYACGTRIKKNQTYYATPPASEFKANWCPSCHSASAEELMLDSFTIMKRDLLKKKNNDESEEPWVQCDICELWVHQVCGLFNKGRNDADRGFVCPACLKHALETGKRQVPVTRPQAMLSAKDLPKCRLSDALEERIGKSIQSEKVSRSKELGVGIEEVKDYPELFVRVVNNVEKKVDVTPLFAKEFCSGAGRPDAYLYKQKVVLLFQKINGVDICLYCLYVQEYGDNCPAPNNRVVYLSYLDSVKYFRPDSVAAAGMDIAMRTYVYHEVLMGYLEDVKRRGFCAMYIWACPPLAGDDYIFFCHPNKQKVPRSDRLREWYLAMLRRSQAEGTVTYISNLFDTFFYGGKDHRITRPSVTDLPYLAGDYWPGEAERHLAANDDTASQASGASRMTKKKEKRILLPDGAGTGEIVLAKLAEHSDMQKMKADFIVAHLYESCSHCRVYINGSSRYYHPNPPQKVSIKAENVFDGIALDKPGQGSAEFSITRFQLCETCYQREDGRLPEEKPLGLPSGITLADLVQDTCPIIPPNVDEDPEMDSEFFDTRQQYLSLCQGNHYQFDTLRRARHSSMMTLYHLHNPSEPAFSATCNLCQRDVAPGEGYRCSNCPDFDMCQLCHRRSLQDPRLAHPHPLTAPTEKKFDETQMRLSREDKKKRALQMKVLMQLVFHSASCPGCESTSCAKFKKLYMHLNECKKGPNAGCDFCRKTYMYISLHSKMCTASDCPVPHCSRIRTIRRAHAARQEAKRRDAYRRMMENQQQST
jgi:E1A/CREB-binding protein